MKSKFVLTPRPPSGFTLAPPVRILKALNCYYDIDTPLCTFAISGNPQGGIKPVSVSGSWAYSGIDAGIAVNTWRLFINDDAQFSSDMYIDIVIKTGMVNLFLVGQEISNLSGSTYSAEIFFADAAGETSSCKLSLLFMTDWSFPVTEFESPPLAQYGSYPDGTDLADINYTGCPGDEVEATITAQWNGQNQQITGIYDDGRDRAWTIGDPNRITNYFDLQLDWNAFTHSFSAYAYNWFDIIGGTDCVVTINFAAPGRETKTVTLTLDLVHS